jgi:hypothetical protein
MRKRKNKREPYLAPEKDADAIKDVSISFSDEIHQKIILGL